MALLEGGQVVADSWVRVGDDGALPDGQPALITLARFQAEADTLAGRNAPLGVVVPSNTKPETIAPLLDRLALVAIQFPVFKDGRGFTIARSLRERYGYKGEIRAFGHILPDQYVFLLRCGVTNVEIPDGADPARWAEALGQYDIAYQPAMVGDSPMSFLRRHLSVTGTSKAG